MNGTITEASTYVYVIHGVIPELAPHTAYRRDKHFKAAKRKIIKCPYCGNPFTTVEEYVKVELYRHPAKSKVTCDRALPCKTCHNEVEIIMPTA